MKATERKPYKVVAQEENDGADVIDRETGREIGYVLLWAHGWAAYLNSCPGWSLPFRWIDEREDNPRIAEAIGWQWLPVLHTKYRKDAAERVWTAHTEGR